MSGVDPIHLLLVDNSTVLANLDGSAAVALLCHHELEPCIVT